MMILKLNEDFTFNFNDFTAYDGAVVSSGSATFTITDNEGIRGEIELSGATPYTEGGSFTLTFTPNPAPAEDVEIDLAISFPEVNTAAEADDVTLGGITTASISAGSSTSVDFTINLTDDSIFEGNETFTLTIRDLTRTRDVDSTEVTIEDNDNPTISFETTPVNENAGEVTAFTIVTDTVAEFDMVFELNELSFDINNPNAEALDIADYPDEITILAGDTTVDYGVELDDDDVFEADESFTFVFNDFSAPDGTVVSAVSATFTITDDEDLPSVTGFSTELNIEEVQDASVDFVVTFDNTAVVDFTLAYTVAAIGDNPIEQNDIDNNLILDTELTIVISDLSINKNSVLPIVIENDEVYEYNEQFQVTLNNVTHNDVPTPNNAAVSSAIGTITDEDDSPVFSLTATASASEANSAINF